MAPAKKRKSLTPMIDKRVRRLLRDRNLSRRELIAVLQLATQVENRLGGDDDEYGKDLPGAEEC